MKHSIKNKYLNYLNNKTDESINGDIHEVTLPFFDHFNDALQIYIEESKKMKMNIL